MSTRIYIVREEVPGHMTGNTYLVEAATQHQAISHLVKSRFSAEAASPKEVAQLMSSGLTVQTVTQIEHQGESPQHKGANHAN